MQLNFKIDFKLECIQALNLTNVRSSISHYISLFESVKLPIIASGGIRNGLEIAKCLSLGANMCAMAYPFLKAASESQESLTKFSKQIINELKATMFLTGSPDILNLSKSRLILTGELADLVTRK